MKQIIDFLQSGFLLKATGVTAFFSFWAWLMTRDGNIMVHDMLLAVLVISTVLTIILFIIYGIIELTVKAKFKNKEKRFQFYYKSIPNVLTAKEKELNTNFEKWYVEGKKVVDSFLVQDEKKLRKIKKAQFIVYSITFIIITFLYIKMDIFISGFSVLIWGSPAVSLVALIILLIWHKLIKKEMVLKSYIKNNADFKQEIMPSLVKSFSNDYEYFPDKGINEEDFRQSSIVYNMNEMNYFLSEDLIVSNNKKNNFKLAECRSQKNTTDTEGHKHEHLIYHGLMMTVELNSKNNKWLLIGPYRRDLVETSDNLVKLENELFDSLFMTFSNDPIYARRILTPRFIEFLILFHYYADKHECYFCFDKNKVFAALGSTEIYEEPIYEFEGKKSMEKEKLFYYYKILNIFTSFYKEFIMKNIIS